jgi:quercetin dioxygenase-like cupin family protein
VWRSSHKLGALLMRLFGTRDVPLDAGGVVMQTATIGIGRAILFVIAASLLAFVVGRSSSRFVSGGALATQASSGPPKLWAAGDLKWQDDAILPAVRTVALWGDPTTGEHGMLRKFAAGYAPPPHVHPSAERVIVLSGTIAVRYKGSSEINLGPGSYSEIPANVEHAVKCAETSECVFALISPGPFAIKMVPGI